MRNTQLILSLALLCARQSGGQTAVDLRTRADTMLLERMLRAEDARASSPADVAALSDALHSTNSGIRAIAIRGLGRLERPTEIAGMVPFLSDPSPVVRRAVADGIAQAASHGGAAEARAALRARLDVEKEPSVVGMLAESLGRIVPFVALELPSTVAALEPALGDSAALVAMHGAIRGASSLAKGAGNRTALPPALLDRLAALTTFGIAGPTAKRLTTPAARDSARYVRMVAAMTLFTRAPDAKLVARVAEDPSALVREKAAAAVAMLTDTAVARALTRRLLQDESPIVRVRAIAAYSRRFRAEGCAPLGAAARDRDLTVSLAAIDALATCRDAATDALLDSLARALPKGLTGEWHRAAHALAALPVTGDHTPRPQLDAFAQHPNFFVRAYAARVARKMADTALLIRLAHDRESDVASPAIDSLSALIGHRGDSVYLDALHSIDSQQLMSAAKALQGSKDPNATTALLAALDGLTALKRETSRDGRDALMKRIAELGSAPNADRLRPYLTDFDSVIAAHAAQAITTWTGEKAVAAPARLPALLYPSVTELALLARSAVRIEMMDGGIIELRLFPFDAPTNVARFARLARAGYFNGLTFHRVERLFVVQGGSQHANEYFGDASFTRDELGVENRRGTVGLSTRGRDTGDGQLYFNVIDNLSLDHNYTVFAEITKGLDVMDRLQEGALIRAVTVR